MPLGLNLPQKSIILRYPPSSSSSSAVLSVPRTNDIQDESDESYQLLELPPEIIKAVEAIKGKGKENPNDSVFPLTIKGKPSDDAVLCTPNSTFLLRTVGISNSILVCRTPSSSTVEEGKDHEMKPTLQIRDTCHEILECIPIAPNLERIRTILKDSSWKGINGNDNNLGKRKRGDMDKKNKKVKRWTRDQLNSVIQASEEELRVGLRERNVIEVDGKMLLLPPKELKELLSIILSLLTIYNLNTQNPNIALSQPIIKALKKDHEIDKEISEQVLRLFGELSINQESGEGDGEGAGKDEEGEGEREEIWKADIKKIIREIGNGLLIGIKDKSLNTFEEEWKFEVGEEWRDQIDIKLLEGEYLISPSPISFSSSSSSDLISHFPISQLPLQPSLRFSDLFLTRPKWRPEEIIPFLKGLTREGDIKSRDKLVQKFVRVVKEKDGSWWFPRRSS